MDGAPVMTSDKAKAVEVLVDVLRRPDLWTSFECTYGDMWFVNNHRVLHSRTAFKDANAQERHLLRIWMSPFRPMNLPESMSEFWARPTIPNRGRGGYPSRSGQEIFELP
jgi:alpha-ketoglutarate-dependent taurine dioxygenase